MKEHPTLKGYFVTEDGRVFSYWRLHHHTWLIDYNRIPKELKQCNGTKGYQLVRMAGKTLKVHRVVAETYLPNTNNLPQVNHIDENKKNNCVSNLEWITNAENINHSQAKYYLIENVSTKEVFEIKNLTRWCKENNLGRGTLQKTMGASASRTHHKGFRLISVSNQSHH
jgi:hypothetical protein